MTEPRDYGVVQPRDDSRICVIGVPGQGKTVFRYRFIRPIYRCVLWNPMEDYSIGEKMSVKQYRARLESFRRGALRVTIEPTAFDDEGMMWEYDELCGCVYETGAVHFATEEIALVSDPTHVPPNLRKLAIKGRHRAVSMSFYGQRFHQFPVIVRGTANEIVAYRQTEPDDVDDFNKRIRPNESPISLNELPDHHFVHWTPAQGAVYCAPIPFEEEEKPSENTFDSGWGTDYPVAA